jgi:WD40 repeat protein
MPEIRELHQIDLRSGHIAKLCWSHDGRFLAIPTQLGSTAIFDIEANKVTQILEGHSAITAVGWDPRSDLIMTGSADRSINLWELKSVRRMPYTKNGHREAVHSVEWTDEGAFALTCSVDRIRALDGSCLASGWTKEMEDTVNEHTGFTAAACSFQSSFLLASAAENGRLLILVSLMSAAVLGRLEMERPVRSLAWSPAEDILAVGSGDRTKVYRATQHGFSDPACELTQATPDVHAVTFSNDGSLLASRDSQGLKIWDVEGATLIVTVDDDNETLSGKGPPPGIAFHPERPWLATVMANGTGFRIADFSELVPASVGHKVSIHQQRLWQV